jgi:hypothetical protein
MTTMFALVRREFGDLRRDVVQIKWMLGLTLLLEVATLVKLFLPACP